jgi:hypothetical protein
MRTLTHQDYLLITIIVVAAIVAFGALLIGACKLFQEMRERRLGVRSAKATPSRLRQRSARSPYKISVIRH